MDKQILLLGTLPPPVGGVTIHTKRLMNELRKENVLYSFIDIRPRKKLAFVFILGKLFICKEKIIHYQLNNWKESAVLANLMRLRKKRFISTIHSFPVEYKELKISSKWLIRLANHGISCFVAPGETIKKRLLDAGIKEEKIKIFHTFLPPSGEEIHEDIPEEINEYLRGSGNFKIILANAYKLYLNSNGEDIYGLDMCITACKRIEYTKFIFVCPLIGDRIYYEKCLRQIKKEGLSDRFLIYRKNISLVCLFKEVDVFVRPTITDSYGISVAEALSLGIPAVASDVCERAPGALLFPKGNQEEFIKRIEEAFNTGEKHSIKIRNYKRELYDM